MATALMGYYGFINLQNSPGAPTYPSGASFGNGLTVRCTNVGINAQQKIDKPALVDGRFDSTAYQLGAIEVGGSIAFPMVYDGVGDAAFGFFKNMWKCAFQRNAASGRLANQFDAIVKYANFDGNSLGVNKSQCGQQSGLVQFRYGGCQIDSFEMTVAQGSGVQVSANVIGLSKYQDTTTPIISYANRNSRVMTWNDVSASLCSDSGPLACSSTRPGASAAAIRSISVSVSNNIQRFYTLNGTLFAEDISATKRDITGKIQALGRIQQIADGSYYQTSASSAPTGNITRCSANGSIDIGLKGCVAGGASSEATGGVSFPGVVYEIEEMSLSTDVFVTSFNYHVLAGMGGSSAQTFTDTACYKTGNDYFLYGSLAQ